MQPIDKFLNNITMYRLVLYGLACLSVIALILSLLRLITYSPLSLLISSVVLAASTYITNTLLSRVFKATTNFESVSITSLILFFLLIPPTQPSEILVIALAGVISMASKYLLAVNGKHIFNPAALAAVVAGLINGSAVWWIANPYLLVFTAILGFLIVRKTRRAGMVVVFIVASMIPVMIFSLQRNENITQALIQLFVSWPTIFFASVMLTEPLTIPPMTKYRLGYGAIVGVLSTIPVPIFGNLYNTPELSLLLGNLLSWFVSLRRRLVLTLKSKTEIARDTYEFLFTPDFQPQFIAGQYLEWTLPHKNKDQRGNRRYFTIASSPTEPGIKLGVKFSQPSSSFKEKLKSMDKGDVIVAGQIAGDFVLPRTQKNTKTEKPQELVFMAGGIGITPFRSMVKYMLDTNNKHKLTLFYACNTLADIAYKNFFDEAAKQLNLKVIYIVADQSTLPKTWSGETGFLTKEILLKYLPQANVNRVYYISGPNVMVEIYKKMLGELDVEMSQIVTDYFPGFA